jgi:hypothetical protein
MSKTASHDAPLGRVEALGLRWERRPGPFEMMDLSF